MEPSRYLKFVRALALGGVLMAGCGEDDGNPPEPDQHGDTIADAGADAEVDAAIADAAPVDAEILVDGPLPPPDLPA